jgi:hypothetical protein
MKTIISELQCYGKQYKRWIHKIVSKIIAISIVILDKFSSQKQVKMAKTILKVANSLTENVFSNKIFQGYEKLRKLFLLV